jgi:exodeoxyribonuclease VII small subunit
LPDAPNGQAPEDNLTFEQAYAELEQTVQTLQQGQLSLDETLRLYERGSFLSHYCLEKLEGVEMKVTQLLAHADGSYSTRVLASEKDVSEPAPQPAEPAPRPRQSEQDDDPLRNQRELFQ